MWQRREIKGRNTILNLSQEGNDVTRVRVYCGEPQSHVISRMGLVQSPIKILHRPPLGIINLLGVCRKNIPVSDNPKPTLNIYVSILAHGLLGKVPKKEPVLFGKTFPNL